MEVEIRLLNERRLTPVQRLQVNVMQASSYKRVNIYFKYAYDCFFSFRKLENDLIQFLTGGLQLECEAIDTC